MARSSYFLYLTETRYTNSFDKTSYKEGVLVLHRHLDGIKGNFSVTEQEYVSAFSFNERGFSEWMIYSNFKEIVEHQQYIFDSLWNTSSSAERKTLELRNGASLGLTEIIDNPSRIQRLFIDLIKTAKSEVLLMLPTVIL
jgi:two-component system, OmpR family, sensor histidine kinase VicK